MQGRTTGTRRRSRTERVQQQELQQQEQQQQQAGSQGGLVGISHRHDAALSHNPTPSETLIERQPSNCLPPMMPTMGTLGAAPSQDNHHQHSSAIVLPQSLFGEAAESAREVPPSSQRISSQKVYEYSRGGSDDQIIPEASTTSLHAQLGSDVNTLPAPASPMSSPAVDKSQRKRTNSDGSHSSTLVTMLMKSSPARRLRPRVGAIDSNTDEGDLFLVKSDENACDDESSSSSSSGGGNDGNTNSHDGQHTNAISSKYDYDPNWDMVGHRTNMISESISVTNDGVKESDSQTSGVLSAAVAASAAIAATVYEEDQSNRQTIESTTGEGAINSRSRAITPTDLIASSMVDDKSEAHSRTPSSTVSGNMSASGHAPKLSAPSSPIHLAPRRRTRSTPNAVTSYMASYDRKNLTLSSSVIDDDGFEAVQNISPETEGNDTTLNPFDDFGCTPTVPSANRETGSESNLGASIRSVQSGSTSSSSSVTHRRRRVPGMDRPTTVIRGAASPSVSSFSGSLSTATASVHPHTSNSFNFVHTTSIHRSSSTTNRDDASESTSRAARSLRVSLDAGMAAIGRWARSHAVAGSAAASATQAGGSSRAATMQLGEEDLFALTNAGADPRRSISDLEGERGANYHHGFGGLSVFAPIAEEDEGVVGGGRHRAFSEPDRAQVRNFFRLPSLRASRRPGQANAAAITAQNVVSHLSSSDVTAGARSLSSAAMTSSIFHANSLSPQAAARSIIGSVDVDGLSVDEMDLLERGSATASQSPLEEAREGSSRRVGESGSNSAGNVINTQNANDADATEEARRQQAAQERRARRRWVRVNQRFQVLITVVALLFSLILFAVLVCWVVLTSSYVVSMDKPCDVPLSRYFWLATIQLVFDIFRTDIMRFALRWDPNSGQPIPPRVVLYNVGYLIYAICTLRIGVISIYFSPENTCTDTAPEFYQAAAAFVTLSLSAWGTIVIGYLIPFIFVAIILTHNGYSPSSDINGREELMNAGLPGVFPNAYVNSGAPPECIDRLQVIMLHEFPDDYPRECCICMGNFAEGEVIVVTNCEHVFHKHCCQEWLEQARTCPVCRMDIPAALGMSDHGSDGEESVDGEGRPRPNRPPLNREEFHQEVVSLLRILRQHEERLRERIVQPEEREDGGQPERRSSGDASTSLSRSFGGGSGDIEERMIDSEEAQSLHSSASRSIRPRSE